MLNGAVWSDVGFTDVYLGAGSPGDCVVNGKAPGRRKYQIETFTFDHLIDRYMPDDVIDICKIDIEGAEYEVLGGDKCGKLSRCKNVIIEVHPDQYRKVETIVQFMARHGFAECKRSSVSNNIILFQNQDVVQ